MREGDRTKEDGIMGSEAAQWHAVSRDGTRLGIF
jgi:hypothetical protein